MRLSIIILLAVLVVTPAATAGSADDPEVTDPAGDAGPNGVAVPAGFEDRDITAAWLEGETLQSLDLVIQLAGPWVERPQSGVEQTFVVNGTTFAAGYVNFQPFFAGHYMCEGEMGNGRGCFLVDGTIAGNLVTVSLPRSENFSAVGVGDELVISGGLTFQLVSPFYGMPIDQSPEGRAYVFTVGVQEEDRDELADELGEALGATAVNETQQQDAPTNDTPWPGVVAAVLGAAGAAWLRRR